MLVLNFSCSPGTVGLLCRISSLQLLWFCNGYMPNFAKSSLSKSRGFGGLHCKGPGASGIFYFGLQLHITSFQTYIYIHKYFQKNWRWSSGDDIQNWTSSHGTIHL